MTVRQLLEGKGTFVPSICSDKKVMEVVDQLEIDDAGALVVTDNNRSILGIISERDIVRGLKSMGGDFLLASVSDVMTTTVISCDFGQPLSSILELMDYNQIRHVPITRDGELCGVIDMLDVVKCRLTELENEASALKQYVAGQV